MAPSLFLPPLNRLPLPLLLLLLHLIIHSPNPSSAAPRATEAGIVCSSNNTAPISQRQTFIANFIAALDALTPQVASHGYGKSHNGSVGGNLTSVYAFSECIKDLSPNDCNLCFSQIKTQIVQKCLPYQSLVRGGRLYFDGCFIRYDYSSEFYRESVSSQDQTRCGSAEFGGGNKTVFRENVLQLVMNLSAGAVNNGRFFSAGSLIRKNVTVYGLAQCWQYLNLTGCKSCLDEAVSSIASACPPKVEGRALNAGCYLRYSTHKFYNTSLDPSPMPTTSNRGSPLAVILATVLSSLAVLMFLVGAVFIGRKYMKKRRESKQLGNLLSTMNKSKLHFSYEILEEATNYFDESKKLGQGGSGSVYKGRLADGSDVAIKRLFFNTRQWVDHFFNEINLISSIEHKNLVKLLGCSITGPESLLVYEYVSNQSLHHHIFGKEKGKTRVLSWEDRYRIILGIAEGLAYLHEESGFRIIHRDIKLNNVLLDRDLTPKIADFGLVRLIPEDKSHLTTAIAGTLGYMAPEYIVCGILTEKADVYSFGVVLIEVISGQRNNSLNEDSVCMLHYIWSLYVRSRLVEGVDQALEGKFKGEEACRLLHIGLLCVQANAELRPTMTRIVKMIIDQNNDGEQLPEPTQPPYLNSSSAEITRQIQSEASCSSRSLSPRISCTTRETTVTDNSWVGPR